MKRKYRLDSWNKEHDCPQWDNVIEDEYDPLCDKKDLKRYYESGKVISIYEE